MHLNLRCLLYLLFQELVLSDETYSEILHTTHNDFFLIPNSCHRIFIANVTVAPTEQDSSPGEERSQSDGGQGFRGSEVDHLHPDQLSKNPELVAAPGMKEAQKAGTLVCPSAVSDWGQSSLRWIHTCS